MSFSKIICWIKGQFPLEFLGIFIFFFFLRVMMSVDDNDFILAFHLADMDGGCWKKLDGFQFIIENFVLYLRNIYSN